MKRILKFIGCLALGCVGLTTLADTVAKIEGKGEYETFAAAVAVADTGDRIEIVKAGEYKLGTISKNVTVSGAVDNVAFNCYDARNAGSAPQGATFENIWFKFGNFGDGEGDQGIWNAGPLTFNGCKFSGKFWGYSELYFNNCEFNQDQPDMYCLWTYGSKKCVFDGCTFNCTGKAVNVYNVGDPQVSIVIARNCTFNATEKNKSAFQINASYASSFTVIVDEGTCELKGEFVDLGFANIKSVPEKTVVAVGKDIVLDENDKIVSGDFSRYEAGATAQNPISPQSMVSVDPQTGKAIVKEKPAVAEIGEKKYYTINEAFGAAVSGETILLLVGEHDLSAESVLKPLTGKSITLKGEVGADGKPLTKLNWGNGLKYGNTGTGDFTNTDFVFDSLEFFVDHTVAHTTYPSRKYQTYEEAIPHPRSQKYVNCVINGQICSMDDVTFDGCTFTGPTCSEDEYLVWNYKGLTVLKNCTFLGTGSKAPIKQYGVKGSQCDMEVIGCTFATVGSEKGVVTSSNGDNAPNAQGVYNGIVYGLKFDTGIVIPEGGRMVSYETGQWAAKYVTVLNGEKDANGKYVNGTLLTENRDTVEDQRARVKASSSSFMAPGFVFAIDEDGNMFIEPDPITGSGTEADPYVIKDLKGLKAFRDRVNAGNTYAGKFFVLDADIDLNNENWEPIGTATHPYAGNGFDGQNHTISNLYIHGVDLVSQGLFGKVMHDQNKPAYPFKNLTIVNVDIDLVAEDVETCGAAALIGEEFADSEVVNVKVTGSISIKAAKWAGGIVGWGLLQYTDCTVEDTTEDGGVIAAGYAVGGIAGGQGYYSVKGGKVTNCSVSNVTVLGDQRVGGLVGINSDGNHDYMSNTVQKVKLAENPDFDYSVKYTTFGKLLGCDNGQNANMPTRAIDNDVKVDTCVIPEGVMNIGGNASGVKDPAAMAIVGWNVTYDNQKKIIGGTFEQLPTGVLGEGCVMDIDPTGKIVVLGPLVPDDQGVYHIATMQDLKVFRLMVNGGNTFGGKTVVLDNDITFAGEWNSGIGDGDHKFMGMFDGQGYKITGLKISAADKDTIGLFGFVDESGAEVWNSWVKNLVLDGAQIVGKENVGGIVGYVHRGIIENCTITNSTISGTVKVGSVAGMMYPGRCIGNTIVATTVSGTSHIGGVAGQMVGGSVSGNVLGGDDAASKVTVTATAKKDECGAGGLVGAVSCSDGGKNYVNDNTIKCAEAITDGVTAPIPFCDFRKNLFSKDESKVEIKRNTWPTVDPNADYYDMVDFASTSEPKDYLRVYNFHPVAEIAGKGLEYRYETVKKALQAAATFPGTVDEPTVVQFYPGVVSAASFTVENFELNNVVVQGSENFASILKDTAIQSDGGSSIVWKGVTFKGILWDNSHLRASVFGFEDLAFIGNKFVNLVGSESAVHFTLQGPMCKNLTFVGNVFEGGESGTAAAINCASAAIKCLTGEITITNNVFKSAPWRSFCVRVDANDGIADKVVITDNWFDGNKSCDWVNIQGNADNVVVQYQYNVKDDNRATSSATIDGVDGDNATLIADHNYFARTPDAAPGAFYVNDYRKAGNIYDAGVYPYYNAYHKDELAAGTTTVRQSLYNLVDPAAIVVNEDGKFVKMTIADAMAASKPGESVMLIRDATDEEEVVIAGDVTFDKNGKDCGTIKAAEGYLLVDLGGGKYIAKSPVAAIGETKFDTLAKALAAVGNGQTVKVLKSGNVVTEYAKQIGEEGYSEKDGYNRLVFGTDAAFTLDLNGQTLSGRINFTKGDMTVSNGTLKATSQVLNVFGRKMVSSAEEAAEPYTTLTIAADCSVEGGNFGIAVFGGDQGNVYWPLGFGETVNIHGKIKALYGAIQNSGNVGMDNYTANIVLQPEIEALKENLGMGVSAMMAKYGPVVNVYDGAVLATVPGETEDSSQGISSQGMATYNVYGGKISGAEAIGVKGGIVNVMGGEMTAFGVKANPIEAVNSGTEVSGGGIAISTSYNGNYPIIVNVTGGTVKSANNAAFLFEHSWTFNEEKQPVAPCPVVQGVRFAVSGGTFIGATDELAIKVEDAIEGDASAYPANFIEPEMKGEPAAETGSPLCSSRIPAEYIAVGYVEKDNHNGTWTVTKGVNGSTEVQTKDISGEPEVKPQEGGLAPTEDEQEEAKEQAAEIKENIVKAMTDPAVTETTGTGIKETIRGGDGKLKTDIVELANQALSEKGITGQTITAESKNVDSHVEIQLESVEVSAKVEMDTQEQRVVKTELNKIVYDIKPILTIVTTVGDVKTVTKKEIPTDTPLDPPISFNLWLDGSFKYDVATVVHKHGTTEDAPVTRIVKTEKGRKYIELKWSTFSEAIITGSMSDEYACQIGDTPYETVTEALAVAADDAVVYLLKDCDETGLSLKENQKIVTNGHTVNHSVGVPDGQEMVTTKDGEIYAAPEKIDVRVGSEGNGVPIRGFDFTGIDLPTPGEGETIKDVKAAYLAQVADNGNLRWQNYVLFGNNPATAPKLIPQIVKAAQGFSTVTIKAQDGYAVNTPAKCGVGVKFQLMRSDASATGGFVLVGDPKVEPVFQVDVKTIGVKTYWKIQTIFETTEDLPTAAH